MTRTRAGPIARYNKPRRHERHRKRRPGDHRPGSPRSELGSASGRRARPRTASAKTQHRCLDTAGSGWTRFRDTHKGSRPEPTQSWHRADPTARLTHQPNFKLGLSAHQTRNQVTSTSRPHLLSEGQREYPRQSPKIAAPLSRCFPRPKMLPAPYSSRSDLEFPTIAVPLHPPDFQPCAHYARFTRFPPSSCSSPSSTPVS